MTGLTSSRSSQPLLILVLVVTLCVNAVLVQLVRLSRDTALDLSLAALRASVQEIDDYLNEIQSIVSVIARSPHLHQSLGYVSTPSAPREIGYSETWPRLLAGDLSGTGQFVRAVRVYFHTTETVLTLEAIQYRPRSDSYAFGFNVEPAPGEFTSIASAQGSEPQVLPDLTLPPSSTLTSIRRTNAGSAEPLTIGMTIDPHALGQWATLSIRRDAGASAVVTASATSSFRGYERWRTRQTHGYRVIRDEGIHTVEFGVPSSHGWTYLARIPVSQVIGDALEDTMDLATVTALALITVLLVAAGFSAQGRLVSLAAPAGVQLSSYRASTPVNSQQTEEVIYSSEFETELIHHVLSGHSQEAEALCHEISERQRSSAAALPHARDLLALQLRMTVWRLSTRVPERDTKSRSISEQLLEAADLLRHDEEIVTLIVRGLCAIARLRAGAAGTHQRFAESAVQFVEESFANPALTNQLIADAVGVSTSYLAEIFREQRGESLAHYVETLRMQHAKHLLASSKQSIEEIAASTGYSTAHSFRRAFRRRTGCTPRTFRREAASSR